MRKKLKIISVLLFFPACGWGFHNEPKNAGKLTIGILPNERLDNSSVTKMGPTIEISEITGGASNFLLNAVGVAFSSHIADGSLGGADIAADAIGGTQTVRGIVNGVLTINPGILRASHTIAQQFGLVEVGSGVITSSMIVTSTYLSSGIANISRYHLKVGETGGILEDRTSVIYSSHIVNESILGEDILNGTILGIDVGDDSLAAVDIQRSRSNGGMVETGAGVIFSSMTNSGSIVANAAGVIFSSMTTGLMANTAGVIFSTMIAENTITGSKLTGSTVEGTKIASETITSSHILNTSISSVDVNTAQIFTEATSTFTAQGGLRLFGALEMSSFTNRSSSFSIGGISLVMQSTTPANGTVPRYQNGIVSWGGDLDTITSGVSGSTVGIRGFQIVIGTLGAQNVDIASSNIDGVLEAYARFGCLGLADATTAPLTIIFRRGTYNLTGATIPFGVTWTTFDSSVTIVVSSGANAGTPGLWLRGQAENLIFSANGDAVDREIIALRTGAIFRNNTVTGIGSLLGGVAFTPMLGVRDLSDNVLVENNFFDGLRAVGGVAQYGDDTGFMIRDSTGVTVRHNKFKAAAQVANSSTGMSVYLSSSVSITDNIFENVGGHFFSFIGGNRDIEFKRNRIVHSQDIGAEGMIFLQSSSGNNSQSTGSIVVEGNMITSVFSDNGRIIDIGEAATPIISGLVIRNNDFRTNVSGTSLVFIGIGAAAVGTIIMGNTSAGELTTITDAGVATQFTGNDNFRGTGEQ